MRKIDYRTELGDLMPYAPNINRVGNDGSYPDRCREISQRPNLHLLVFAVIHHALFGLLGKSIGYAGLAGKQLQPSGCGVWLLL